MLSVVSALSGSKQVLVLILLIIIVTIVDSQFINIFYGTDLGTPGNLHLLLFVSFVIVASIINTILLLFAKRNDVHSTTSRSLLFRAAYIGTSIVQYTISLILFITISEMLIFHEYNKIFSLLVVFLSHFWSAIILGILSLRFIQWFRFATSFSILIYAVVFSMILFLILITVPLLTQQFTIQSQMIYPRDYTSLIAALIVPSQDIAFIYGLGGYVLPLMIISSWILTVLLLKPYANRIGKKRFWLIVAIPLLYQLFSFIVRDSNLVTDPTLVEIIYSQQFQVIFGISYQVSGLFFAIAFLIIGRKLKRKGLKNYLIICSIGIVSLFSSMQPGMPFYAVYPPFGLVTLLFLGLSSYLLLVGMLGCAAYVSRDIELRREIYKGLEVDADVLKKIGMAEMQREIEKRVLPLASKIKLSDEMRRHMDTDPDEEDVKTMIDEVLNEIHKGSHIKPGHR
ncbi:MAG TPA: hypothetical protein VE818_12795 [Nitrososphaeraceae archaeon]|nr:hypothetical protein [Nitrososphaeraceae archaeon]